MKALRRTLPVLVFMVAFLAVSVLMSSNASATTLDVKAPTKLTTNTNYGRNPSIVKYSVDGNYWLFWTVSENGGERGSGSPPYDPDADSYTIWYKNASTIAGLESATAYPLPSSTPQPVLTSAM